MTATRKNIMLGTAGHVDHGKTALVKVLTGCDTDTLAEEKQRGLTIDLGFAPCRLAGGGALARREPSYSFRGAPLLKGGRRPRAIGIVAGRRDGKEP